MQVDTQSQQPSLRKQSPAGYVPPESHPSQSQPNPNHSLVSISTSDLRVPEASAACSRDTDIHAITGHEDVRQSSDQLIAQLRERSRPRITEEHCSAQPQAPHMHKVSSSFLNHFDTYLGTRFECIITDVRQRCHAAWINATVLSKMRHVFTRSAIAPEHCVHFRQTPMQHLQSRMLPSHAHLCTSFASPHVGVVHMLHIRHTAYEPATCLQGDSSVAPTVDRSSPDFDIRFHEPACERSNRESSMTSYWESQPAHDLHAHVLQNDPKFTRSDSLERLQAVADCQERIRMNSKPSKNVKFSLESLWGLPAEHQGHDRHLPEHTNAAPYSSAPQVCRNNTFF